MVQDSRHANGVDGMSKGVHRWRIPDCGWDVVSCHNCCWKKGILVDIYPGADLPDVVGGGTTCSVGVGMQ